MARAADGRPERLHGLGQPLGHRAGSRCGSTRAARDAVARSSPHALYDAAAGRLRRVGRPVQPAGEPRLHRAVVAAEPHGAPRAGQRRFEAGKERGDVLQGNRNASSGSSQSRTCARTTAAAQGGRRRSRVPGRAGRRLPRSLATTTSSCRRPSPLPATRLRAMWRNWAGDQQCVPARDRAAGARSTSCAASSSAAAARGLTVRAAGSGHSFTDIACTDGVMLRLERHEPGARRRPRERPGQGRGAASCCATSARRSGTAGWRCRASATSTCRRSPARSRPPRTAPAPRFGNISAQVEAIELVLADGTRARGDQGLRPRHCCAPRASALGSLGVIATVTLRCVPAFTLRRHDHPLPLDETLARLDELIARNRPLRVLRVPAHRRRAVPRDDASTTAPPRAARPRARVARRTCCSRTTCSARSCALGAPVPVADPADQPAGDPRGRAAASRSTAATGCSRPRRPGALHRDGVRDPARGTGPRRCGACSR